jgi:uncharacterized protein (TIGR02246 family)
MASGVALQDIHSAVERTINDGDLEGLIALYAADARMVGPDGSTATGTEEIREALAPLLAMGGRMTVTTRAVVEAGDVALLSSEWSFTAGDVRMSGIAAEVVRREPGGGWLYVVDHPYAAPSTTAGAPAEAASAQV